MKPILYDYNERTFSSQGLGVLYDTISCAVTEERNGMYECQMVYSIDGIHFNEILNDRIILAKPNDSDDPQPFRIYRITKPLNGKVTIYSEHISYQLSKIPVSAFTASNVSAALSSLKTNAMIECPFTFWTDKDTVANFAVKEPSSIRSRLGGTEGSILDAYGGEWKFDRYYARLYENRGENRGVVLRYGKNITDISQENNIANVYTGVVPFWKGEVDGVEVIKTLPSSSAIVYISNHASFPYEKVVPVDLSDKFDEEPTDAQLRNAANAYIEENEIGVPDISIKVSFVALWNTEEYKNIIGLEQVRLCDTVSVEFEKLGISVNSKVIKTVYDSLNERYNSIELGKTKSNFAKTVKKTVSEAVSSLAKNGYVTTSAMNRSIDRATQLITGGLGGYVMLKENANGQPEEILILGDDPDYTVAQNVWRWNRNGLAFSSTGYNGTFRTAITADGHIVADFIDVGSLNAALITVLNLSASVIKSGILEIGGTVNPDGAIKIYNALNQVVGTWDKNGISVLDGTIGGWSILPDGIRRHDSAAEVSVGMLPGTNQAGTFLYVNDTSANAADAWPFAVYKSGIVKMAKANITGGNMSLGGVNNVNGYLELKDRKNRVRIRMGSASSSLWNTDAKAEFSRYSNEGDTDPSSKIEIDGGNLIGYGYNNSSLAKLISFNAPHYSADTGKASICAEDDAESIKLLASYDSFLEISKTSDYHPAAPYSSVSRSYYSYIRGGLYSESYIGGREVCGVDMYAENLTVYGTKSRGVSTDDYSDRLMYCYETPSPMFGDVGEGIIGSDGKCYVSIDPIFAETVSLKQYQVFLQKYGSGECYVSERNGSYFVVEGTPNLEFGWELKAKQADFDQLRLERDAEIVEIKNKMDYAMDAEEYMASANIDYGGMAVGHIKNIMIERKVA